MKIEELRLGLAENGFILEFSGRDVNDDWFNAKEVFTSWDSTRIRIEEVIAAKETGDITRKA